MIRLWPLVAGFSLWLAAFTALYALQYLGCYFAWDPLVHRIALVGGYGLSLALMGATLAYQYAGLRSVPAPGLLDRAGLLATAAALGATAITFAPTLVVSICI